MARAGLVAQSFSGAQAVGQRPIFNYDGTYIASWVVVGATGNKLYKRASNGAWGASITISTSVSLSNVDVSASPIEDKWAIATTTPATGLKVATLDRATDTFTSDTVNQLNTGALNMVRFSPDGQFIIGAALGAGLCGIRIFKRTNSTTWDEVARDQSAGVNNDCRACFFNHDGTRIIQLNKNSVFGKVYTFNPTTYALTALTTPFDTQPASCAGAAINPVTDDLTSQIGAAPGFNYWLWDESTVQYKKQTNAAGTGTLGTANHNGKFSRDGKYLCIDFTASPWFVLYDVDPSTRLLTLDTDQPTGISNTGSGVDFGPSRIMSLGYTDTTTGMQILAVGNQTEKFNLSGFLPTSAIGAASAPTKNTGDIAASGFLPTTAVAAKLRQKATVVTASFLPTTAVAAGTRQKATSASIGFLPTTAISGLVQPDAVIRTSGFLPQSSVQAASKQRANIDANGFLPTSRVNAGTRIKANIDANGFLPTTAVLGGAPKNVATSASLGYLPGTHIDATTKQVATIGASGYLPGTHVVAYSKNLGAIDANGFLPTSHIAANLPIAREAVMVTSGFLPTSKVKAFAEPQPPDEGGESGPSFGSGTGINLGGPILAGGTSLHVG